MTTPLTLPPYRHLKSRKISDYSFSEHADGFDDCLREVMQILDDAGIHYRRPLDMTAEEARKFE